MLNKLALVMGKYFSDERGCITFNNDFDSGDVDRIYFIE
jgi:hypothetical protein